MAKKPKFKEDDKPWEGRFCRECALCDPVMKENTLTVYGREPTLGKCPHVESRCVLLSECACWYFTDKYREFKPLDAK